MRCEMPDELLDWPRFLGATGFVDVNFKYMRWSTVTAMQGSQPDTMVSTAARV